jgi:hypothetical protein
MHRPSQSFPMLLGNLNGAVIYLSVKLYGGHRFLLPLWGKTQ